jgi:dipeptidyl-peptidase 4
MKRILFSCVLTLCISFTFATSLYDILDGKLKTNTIVMPKSMADGENYSLMVKNNAVLKYSYKTGKMVDTLFSIKRLKKSPIQSFDGYEMSPDELKILVYINVKPQSKCGFTANYYIYDIRQETLEPLSEGGPQELPLFSPNSRYIAFSRNNNLFLYKLDFHTEIAITTDGQAGSIINGTPDWVQEQAFKTRRYFTWSADSKQLAFVKFNETDVPEYSFPIYNSEVDKNEMSLYPTFKRIKYPKPGQNNSKLSVCVYDEFYKSVKTMKLPDAEKDFYIPRILFTNSPDQLAIYKLNRNQNVLDLVIANSRSTLCNIILKQEDKRYIDYRVVESTRFMADNQGFIAVSDQDGYRHAYQYDITGMMVKQLTKGNWDVTALYGYDEEKKNLYFQSTETSATQRDAFMVDKKGKKTRLTDGKGTHQLSFNANFTYYVDQFSSLEKPASFSLKSATNSTTRELGNNDSLIQKVKALNLPKKELFSFTTSDNVKLNGWMIKPSNFEVTKKYPVVFIANCTTEHQNAFDSWNYGWENALANEGYVVVSVDTRGTDGRGAEFRKSRHGQAGTLEAKDMAEAAKFITTKSFVDANKMALIGFKYGGLIALSAMSSPEHPFKTAIVVNPITDLRLYNSVFAERYLQNAKENFKGYEQTSAILKADKTQGKILFIHCTAEPNEQVQHTMQYLNKLQSSNKEVDLQLIVDKTLESMDSTSRHRMYDQIINYLNKSNSITK